MTTPRTAPMNWDRKRAGWYEAQAEDGSNWRIAQATSQRWEVYRDGASVADWPTTLADAKWAAEREQQQATVLPDAPRAAPTQDSRVIVAREALADYDRWKIGTLPAKDPFEWLGYLSATVRGLLDVIDEQAASRDAERDATDRHYLDRLDDGRRP